MTFSWGAGTAEAVPARCENNPISPIEPRMRCSMSAEGFCGELLRVMRTRSTISGTCSSRAMARLLCS